MQEKKYLGYNHTIYACYIGYIVQAIVNNFIPLLFLTFQSTFDISLDRITYLITVNFGIQLLVDLASAKFVDRIGYRSAALIAHIMAAVGLMGLGFFPYIFPSAYFGILVSVCFYAVGGGLLEVIVSPIVEACPTDKKDAAMSLLHSFYCWGQVSVVLFSTLFFTLAGIKYWRILACIWALVPLFNIFYFLKVPVNALVEEGESMKIGELIKNKLFWLLFVMMVCSGAAELAMSQWASAFAESAL
ncbi:MAG: MFS transporter [Lachnospiraceae bacterium]|nr:MFS transporter [Lachnospiraceae bacterium]